MKNNNINKLSDELFCINFELETLSKIINYHELERWVPKFCNPNTEKEHLQRYHWICNFTKGKNVLDSACGTGKGTQIIATTGKAKNITGYDIDKKVIKYAKIKNKKENITFKEANLEKINDKEKFDMIVSFETIEHLKDYSNFLVNIKNALIKGGYFFVSTPISPKGTTQAPPNKFHKIEWSFKDFQEIISKEFTIEKVFLQLYQPDENKIKLFIKKILKRKIFRKLQPIREYKKHSCNKNLVGYQILKCKKI